MEVPKTTTAEPKTRQQCYDKYSNTVSPAFFCDATWDGMLCWPPTMPGNTLRKPCPPLPGFDVRKYAYKTCQADGKWYRVPTSTREWTNYTNCETETLTVRPRLAGSREQTIPLMRYDHVVAFVFHSLSVTALVMAVLLFACNASKKSRRHQVLIPLFSSAMALSLASVADLSIDQLDKRTAAMLRKDNVCQAVVFVARFFQIATVSWIMSLGINYVIPAMSCHFRSGRLLLMYLLGFGIPLVFTPAWLATARYVTTKDTFCKVQKLNGTHWIADGPKTACLFVAFVLFVICVSVVCRKKPSHTNTMFIRSSSELEFLKEGSARGLFLVAYCLAVEVFLNVSLHTDLGIGATLTTYIVAVVNSTYGLIIAIFLGFTDTEICCCGREPPDHLIVEGSYRLRSTKY